MRTFKDFFRPQFVSLERLPEGGLKGTITSAGCEDVGNPPMEKPVVRIEDDRGDEWALVANQNNLAALGAMYGRNFSLWEGRPIVLVSGTVTYKNKKVGSVVVDGAATRRIQAEITRSIISSEFRSPSTSDDSPF